MTSYIYFLSTTWDFQQCGMCDQQSLRSACAYSQSDQSLCCLLEYFMTVKLLTKQHLEFLRLKGGFTGSSESTLVKMPHCWKSHVVAHMFLSNDNTVQSVSLAVSVVLSILDIYVLLPFSEAVGTFGICANVNIKRPH